MEVWNGSCSPLPAIRTNVIRQLPHRHRPAGMEHASLLSLAVVTLLQLCRAELIGPWYSANVINGNGEFAPKPISEIFSTSDPIVILPSSTSSPIETYPTSAKTASSPYSTTASTYDYVSSTQSSYPTVITYDTQPTRQSTMPQWTPSQSTSETQPPTNKQDQMDLKPFPFPMMPQPETKNPPNYFLIYQQAPQNIQNFPTPAAQQAPSTPSPPSSYPTESTYTSQSSTFSPEPTSYRTDSTPYRAEVTSYLPDRTSYQPDRTSYQPDRTSYKPDRTELTTYHRDLSSWQTEKTTPHKTMSTYQPDYASTYPPDWKTDKPYKSTYGSTNTPCDSKGKPLKNDFSKFPSLRIRVASPRGTITNINLNPPVPTTTKKPTTTTKRRVTTTKTRRTKKTKNNYDGCVRSCDGKRSPICASPLSMKQIDPDSLKGFPSICHMACHNSFKNNQYEMLVEGRCGRLRTRIRTVDSYNKMKRDELNKVQYAIVDHPQTVLEFASLPR